MLIEDGYAHSLKALLDKSRADGERTGSPVMSGIVFPRWAVIVSALVVLFCLTIFLASLVVIYIGDEYVRPAFSEQSVPPPRSYQ